MQSSLQPSSVSTYTRAWRLFSKFHLDIFESPNFAFPILPSLLACFIAYMFDKQYASSTIESYLSALAYYHKLSGFGDPTKVFFLGEIVKGCRKLSARVDNRLPISLPILSRIIQMSGKLFKSEFEVSQFCAMCTLAFYAFLRVGEITFSVESKAKNILLMDNVHKLVNSKGEVLGVRINFGDFKHNYNQHPISVIVNCQSVDCPVKYLLNYLSLRGSFGGYLFADSLGNPVSRYSFSQRLNLVLKACGLDTSRYKGHSFRIGAASLAAMKGMSDAQIRALGRWKSNAFLKYIRIPSISL